MPTIVRAANDEIMASPRPSSTGNTPSRRVLGDVSTNARVNSQPPAPLYGKKIMTGSPLKRSFTAAIEGGQGFTYLKKRRVSGDQMLSQVDGSAEDAMAGTPNAAFDAPEPRSRSTPEPLLLPGTDGLVVSLSSPTEPNTPSDSGDDTQGSSAERKSFSSLINYDLSSQQQLPPNPYSAPPTSGLVFKSISKAEMLRLRLRVAMYKVRTNQISTPFAELRIEGEEARPKSTSEAVEEAVAALRQEAQERMPTDELPAVPKLQPGPVLRPTAYSSRMLYYDAGGDGHDGELTPGQSPAKSVSTPMGSAEKLARAESADLTSSAVKGRVAEGLLGLRNGL